MSVSLLELIVESDGVIDGAAARVRFTRLEELLSAPINIESLEELYLKLLRDRAALHREPDDDGIGRVDHLTEDEFGLVITAVELVLLRFILMEDVLPRPDGANANEN